ncbi:hypothetical protein PABE173_3802 [Pseudomonas aeruginosa ATCC 25324]|nr:hypothetical protein PABE173_3802 [Pseudomonas aeruginosa ATCC 25324]
MVRGVCSIYCPNCVKAQVKQAEAERPEVFGLERYRVEKTGQGFWPYCVRAGDGTRELFAGHLKQCKRVAAQLATAFEDGKFVAGALRAENAKLSEALDRWPLIRDSLKLRLADALARVAELESKLAELERQEPAGWLAYHFGGKWNGKIYGGPCDTKEEINRYIQQVHQSNDSVTLQGKPFYAAPVAQAQHSVPEGFIGRLSEFLAQRGATGKALLRELRDMLAAAPARGQHSVPEEFSFEYRHPNGECHTVTVSREQVINEMPDFLFEALCSKFCNCEPVGETNVVECRCDEYAEEFKLLAAAPGKEGL